MGRVLEMKMAKADKDDIARLVDFFNMLEEVIEHSTFTKQDDDEPIPMDIDDEKFQSLLRKMWGLRGPGVASAWRRVVFGCDILIDNCCDPDADTLEFKPEFQAMSADAVRWNHFREHGPIMDRGFVLMGDAADAAFDEAIAKEITVAENASTVATDSSKEKPCEPT